MEYSRERIYQEAGLNEHAELDLMFGVVLVNLLVPLVNVKLLVTLEDKLC